MISNHSQGSSGFLLGWADEGVRPYVVRAAACVGAGALTRPAERSSATSFRDCCRAALGLDGRDARPSMGIACQDRKSTRLNSSHANISYAVFCLKKNNI